MANTWQMRVSEKLDGNIECIAVDQGITKYELIKTVMAKYAYEANTKREKKGKAEKGD